MILQNEGRGDFTPYFYKEKIVILNSSGICIASEDSEIVGKKLEVTDENRVPAKDLTDGLLGLVIKQCLMIDLLDNKSEHSIDLFITKIISQAFDPTAISGIELEAKILGLNFDIPRVAIVICYPDFEERYLATTSQNFDSDEIIQSHKKIISDAICGFFTKNKDIITAYIGNSKFVVFKAMENVNENNFKKNIISAHSEIFRSLSSSGDSPVTVGFSNPYKGIEGIAEAYREANLAQEISGRLSKKEASYFFGDMNLLYLFASELGRKMVNDKKFLENLSRPMVRTLETFLEEDLNISKTARKLHVHRNSVNYRLDKIAQILKLDPRKFEHATTILILLLSNKLFRN